MVQIQPFGARQPIGLAPAFRRPITAGGEEPVHNSQVDRPFHIEPVAPRRQGLLDDAPDGQILPQSSEDQVRTNPLHLDGFGLAGGVRIDHRQSLAEAQTRAQKRVQLTAGLEGSTRPRVLKTR